MAYEKKHVATLDALQQLFSKVNEQIATDEKSLANYLKTADAQKTYATKAEVEKKADETKLADYLTTAAAAEQYATKADISSAYKPKGSVDDLAGLAELNVEGNVGNVYNVKAAFTTDETFLEGTGKEYPAGTNVVVVEDQEEYKFDALSGIVDLTNYVDNDALTSALTPYAKSSDIADTYETKANVTSGLAGKADKKAITDMLTKTEASGESGYVPKADVATDEEVTALVNELFPAE